MLEIDGEPAFDVLCSDLGFNTIARIREAAPWLHAARPVPGSSEADYLVRNIVGLDAQNGIVALGALIDPGERLIFVRRDPAAAEADLRRMLRGAKARLSRPAQGGVYVSCLARGPYMFGSEDRELEIVREEIGDLPLAGMYQGARTLRIADGPDEVHRVLIAKNILRRYHAGESWDFGN